MKIRIFEMFDIFVSFLMAVLGPRRVSIGFPDPVGSILAEYEPEPTHLDPIRCPNRVFLIFFGSYFLCDFPTSAK